MDYRPGLQFLLYSFDKAKQGLGNFLFSFLNLAE